MHMASQRNKGGLGMLAVSAALWGKLTRISRRHTIRLFQPSCFGGYATSQTPLFRQVDAIAHQGLLHDEHHLHQPGERGF